MTTPSSNESTPQLNAQEQLARDLQEIIDTEEGLERVESLNYGYHQAFKLNADFEYNRLKHDSHFKQGRTQDQLMAAAFIESERLAELLTESDLNREITNNYMPLFAPDAQPGTPEYDRIFAVLLRAARASIDDLQGQSDERGNRAGGVSTQLRTGRIVPAPIENNPTSVESSLAADPAVTPIGTPGSKLQSPQPVDGASAGQGEQYPAPDAADEFIQAYERLETLRSTLAKLAARKSGKAISLFNTEYNQALSDYNDQLIAVGRMREAQLEAENQGRTDNERNIETIGYLLDEQRDLREATITEFQSSKTNKFIEWFNRGSWGARFAKGVAVGAPAAVLAAFAAPAGAAAAVVTGGVMGARFTRSYARHDKQRGTNISLNGIDQAGMQTAVQTGGADRRLENAVTQLTGRFDTDKKDEQEKRRKSLYWGLGGIALGTTLGAAYNAYHHFSPRNSYQGMKDGVGSVKDKLGIGDSSNTPPAETKIPGPTQASTTGSSIDITSDTPAPADAATTPEAPDWSDAAGTVDPGEGWYQTFEDMDIPSDEWQDLLNNVGPELQQEGWAYRMPSGDWGISRPGELPESMLQLIQDSRH